MPAVRPLVIGFFVAAVIGVSAGFACAGVVFNAGVQQTLTYNPFQVTDTRATVHLHVRQTGGNPCAFQLTLTPRSSPPQFGGALSYAIDRADSGAAGSAFTVTTPRLKPGQEAKVELALNLIRGQDVPQGQYGDSLGIELRRAHEDSSGGGNGRGHLARILDRAALPITVTVPPIVQLNLGGGGITTTLDFGELRTGAVRAVVLQARATGNYNLRLSSKNNGVMLQDQAPAGNSISYSVALNGRPVDVRKSVDLGFSRVKAETIHRLIVTIGDVSGKRAGLYRDVLIIAIAPRI